MKIGYHTQIKGLTKEINTSKVSCAQVFLSSPYKYMEFFDKLPSEDLSTISSLDVYGHGPYVMNLANPKPQLRKLARMIVYKSLEKCAEWGLKGLTIHPGSVSAAPLSGEEYLDLAKVEREFPVPLFLETMPHPDSCGNPIRLRKLMSYHKIVRGGITMDTAHLFALGYDLTKASVLKELWDMIGPWVRLVHLNEPDPNVKLASHLDRHASVPATGAFGSAFWDLYDFFAEKSLPMIVEHPEGYVLDRPFMLWLSECRNRPIIEAIASEH